LTTNTALSARELALKYKQLWMVEAVFRTAKSQLDTRPIFHKCATAHFSDRGRRFQRDRGRRFRLIVDDQGSARVKGLMVSQSSTMALKR
jgi:hypothetical protein